MASASWRTSRSGHRREDLSRVFTLTDTLVMHQVMNHRALVSVRRDFHGALFGEGQEMLGALSPQRLLSLAIDRTHGSWWAGFRGVFMLGMRHIAEGTDHLLFLLVLLLPAPLLARTGRWREPDGPRASLGRIIGVVTAFTVGHSLTLVAARWAGAPAEPARGGAHRGEHPRVRGARGATALPGPRAFVAAGFGLVHGLAFATVLAGQGFDAWALASSILGFNLGIEVMQAAVVVLVLPWLTLREPCARLRCCARRCGGGRGRRVRLGARAGPGREHARGSVGGGRGGHAWVGLLVLAAVSLGLRSRSTRMGNALGT